MPPAFRQIVARSLMLAAVVALAGCAIAKPRTDDPWEGFNRKAYAFNHAIDKIAIRPVAVTYRKVTTPGVREHVNNFFSNIQLPVTVANDLLQARPKRALETSGRFLVNLTIGFLGFFDPASQLGIPEDDNDFGVTLARWGVPDGPYLVLPFVGPTTARDFWRLPVDSYLFNPLSIYSHNHEYHYGQQYLPQLMYLITLRSRAIDAESFLESAYDPYVFLRDAYRQRRLYKIYYGNPPAKVIERMQGLDEDNFDPEKLLEQQHAWEKRHDTAPTAAGTVPAPASSSGR
ncbi:MAG TPA: VacJ family lipoprotein [Oleiagrimonas sp.]|nr:VacJ family lipoprotein [Oleiagrimonas sp.]